MRFLSVMLGLIVAAGFLAGCSGNMSSPSSSVPSAGAQGRGIGGPGFRGLPINVVPARFLPKRIMPMRGKRANAAQARGIYVGSFSGSTVWGSPRTTAATARRLAR